MDQRREKIESISRGRNVTSVTAIEDDARVEELARLLDGSLSDVSVQHARELLKEVAGDRTTGARDA